MMESNETSHGPLAVDLFCGAGGLSYGLQQAGFRSGFALDFDEHACATYAANVSPHVVRASLSDFSPERICEEGGFRPGDAVLICGGPPCQGFSVQRRGPATDARNDMVEEFARVAVRLKPLFILMENVPTLLGPRGIRYLDSFVSILREAGYACDEAILDAADYGVPQNRRRAFIVGWLKSKVSGFAFPRPLPDKKTVRDAIGDLPEPPHDFSEHPDFANHIRVQMSERNIARISHVPPGGGRLDLPEELQLPCHRNDNGHRHLDVYGRMLWDEPAPTITAMFDNFTRGRFAHPEEDRSITGREGARLQSFPDTFTFHGPKKDVARQIGNAVPPELARHIGRAILVASSTGYETPLVDPSGQLKLSV